MHDFYKVFAAAKTAYADYQVKADKWEERYGENAKNSEKESVYKRLQNYHMENADKQMKKTSKDKDRDRGTR